MKQSWTKKDVSYSRWMAAVSAVLLDKVGLDVDSMPDWPSRDAYDDELTALEGAEMCMEEAGMGFFFEKATLVDEL